MRSSLRPASVPHPDLDQLPRVIGAWTCPAPNLPTTAADTGCQTSRQHIPAKVTMVRRRVGQGIGISRQDLVSDGGQSFAEDLTHIRMPPGAPYNAGDRIGVNISDSQVV